MILLYHFFQPDDVISARLFSDIAVATATDGSLVTAMPSVRSCHDGEAAYRKNEEWNGVEIRRVWRPGWRQGSNKGRVGNAVAMLLGWTWRAIWTRRSKNETVVIGTDPPLSVLVAIPWRLFRPRARIVHWCHDLYPLAAVAEGIVKPSGLFVRGLNAILRVAYARCDVIADLGACMRSELRAASGEPELREASGEKELREASGERREENEEQSSRYVTLTPWALVEPERVLEADEGVRRDLFGDAKLGLLYSGNLGRAHVYQPFVELARRVARDSIAFCYAGRGAAMALLRDELRVASGEGEPRVASCEGRESSNKNPSPPAPLPGIPGRGEQVPSELKIRFAGFASEEELGKRLGGADVHMVSLAPSWTGAVVPSKFFGALAVGRPVLFAGSRKSAIAQWINEFQVGWVLDDDASVEQVAEQLRAFAADPERVKAMREHCFQVYHREFSKRVQLEKWKRILEART